MTFSSVTAKTESISGTEIDLFTARKHHETLVTKYVIIHN
jgi:hypothetical protein